VRYGWEEEGGLGGVGEESWRVGEWVGELWMSEGTFHRGVGVRPVGRRKESVGGRGGR
jgi:hypothetical protein